MEPKNHPTEKQNHLPKPPFLGFHVSFPEGRISEGASFSGTGEQGKPTENPAQSEKANGKTCPSTLQPCLLPQTRVGFRLSLSQPV